MARYKTKREFATNKWLKVYEAIPVYPNFARNYELTMIYGSKKQMVFPIFAPLCENDESAVAFISKSAKEQWLKAFKEQGSAISSDKHSFWSSEED